MKQHRTAVLWISFVLIMAFGVVGFILTSPKPIQPELVIPPPISTGETVEPISPPVVPSTDPSPEPSASAKPSTLSPATITIGGSTPTKLYVPRLKKTVVLATTPCPVVSKNGQAMIDPDRDDFTKACYFTRKGYPYVLPGTAAPDLAVMAGHTSHQKSNAAFNIFYNWKKGVFTLKKGDEVWIQTKKSGSRWLVYKATDLLTPKKYAAGNTVSLMNDAKVWGTAPTPGVLITIGCLQPKDFNELSSENIVIKWQFDRVEE